MKMSYFMRSTLKKQETEQPNYGKISPKKEGNAE